ncbi:MAG: acyl-CoA/acyl-ACP dehydrogenase [Acidimicrobiia bacterium]|jgi:alkylation response protein AidB-like acyl-CoA dehydrogenase|nr:acyl-CoA/acyl-ACP dehydrogenase [Acidimicrobiia bacterium]MDQ3462499.1 acyl-CoA/acyl-ACP dehydrogenase [Actinomycetota bacterium]
MTTAPPRNDLPYLEALQPVIDEVVAPAAVDVDRSGTFPRAGIDALGAAGLLGLLSAPQVGGRGEGHRAAALVIEELAHHCASTAMVAMMHYCAAPLVEAHGPRELREAVAAGEHLLALALSEHGSRSHFWVPVSTARAEEDEVRLDASKSWVTSAGEAHSYVWSSRPLDADGLSTLWLVPADAPGLSVGAPFDGLGLRGNSSSPMTADGVRVPAGAMLGPDGGGFDVMMMVVLPYFQLMNAAFSIGTMDAATTKAAAHVARTRLTHLDQSLADAPTVRSYVARMRVRTDMVRGLLLDTLDSLENGRDDVMLRVLEVKAGAGESATEVTDLAMRVCGGAAFRKEVGVERHFRDARAATVMAPTTDALYDFIGRIACGLPLFEEPS